MRLTAAESAWLLLFAFVTLIALPSSKCWDPVSRSGRVGPPLSALSRRPLLSSKKEPKMDPEPSQPEEEEEEEEASGTLGRVQRHHVVKRTRATLDLDTMIGYAPPFSPSDLPLEAGPQQFLEAGPDDSGLFSGLDALPSSVRAPTTSGTATSAPESGTGTDFGLFGVKDFPQNATEKEVEAPEGAETGVTPASALSTREGVSETLWKQMTAPPQDTQVACVDWTQPSGRGYVLLNMTHNLNCEEFRGDGGVRLLRAMERRFARRLNSPEGSWLIYLSKPTHKQPQMLLHVASEHGVISTEDLLSLLGEMRVTLKKVGIQDYGAPPTCPPRRSPSQRSDYGKLFVVLVVIGSICLVIIASGFVYICWQRRPPAAKSTFHAEELRFVENGCHDNPTLDVAGDHPPGGTRPERHREAKEEKEKKPSANGSLRPDVDPHWQVFVNQAAVQEEEEEEEEDTHL
ncbi:podocalyxin-like protein 2 [Stigmatopora nigra]